MPFVDQRIILQRMARKDRRMAANLRRSVQGVDKCIILKEAGTEDAQTSPAPDRNERPFVEVPILAERSLPQPIHPAASQQSFPAWESLDSLPPVAWGEHGLSALVWSPQFGVQMGEIGMWPDGPRGSVGGYHGCAVRDWGVTMWMPAPPAPVAADKAVR